MREMGSILSAEYSLKLTRMFCCRKNLCMVPTLPQKAETDLV
jgi:hypothetical protein